MSRMTAVVKESPAPGVRVTQVDVPTPGPDDLLLRVRATSICGTDLHLYDWDDWAKSAIRPPLVIGHEFGAEVVEAGRNVSGFREGDLVAVESHIPCGDCVQCRTGMRHICDRVKILGIDRPGCFAEYVAMPALCAWKVPPGTSPEIASIMEPMGNAVHAVDAARVAGRSVAVFGCGPTGLFAAAVCRAEDAARIAAVDVNAKRRELARESGAHETFDGASPNVIERVSKFCGPAGADVVFEMSGNPAAIRNGLKACRKGGTFVAFGLASKPVEIDLSNDVILRGITLLGIVGRRMFETWEKMQRLLDSRKLDPSPILTHRFPLKDFDRAVATLRSPSEKCGKIVLTP